jgi:pilus assembly protein Flp/PilA
MEKIDLNVEQVEQSNKQKGASLVEYALLVALIAVICIVAIRVLGQNISTRFSQTGSAVGAAT